MTHENGLFNHPFGQVLNENEVGEQLSFCYVLPKDEIEMENRLVTDEFHCEFLFNVEKFYLFLNEARTKE